VCHAGAEEPTVPTTPKRLLSDLTPLERDLYYAERVLPVLLVAANKDAFMDGGCLGATTDPDVIRERRRRYPRADTGLATGGNTRLVAVDIDRKEAEFEASLSSVHSDLDGVDTPIVRTKSGGEHVITVAPPGVPIFNSIKRLELAVDVKGWARSNPDLNAFGGYIVAAGSTLGGRYVLLSGSFNRIAQTPPRLLERLLALQAPPRPRAREAYSTGNLTERFERKLDEIGAVPQGQRNDTLFRLGCWLRGEGLSESEIAECLLDVNLRVCRPPECEFKVLTAARSASRYPQGRAA
jgi:Bifunctional DNA primase/polymerase, N-terminal/Primase C terminal 1 (PriCT-1)